MLPGVWAFDIMINDVILCHYCASPLLTCMVKLRDCYNLVISVSTEYCWATWTTPQTSAIYKLYWNLNVTGQFFVLHNLFIDTPSYLQYFKIFQLFTSQLYNMFPKFPCPLSPLWGLHKCKWAWVEGHYTAYLFLSCQLWHPATPPFQLPPPADLLVICLVVV